MYLAYLSNSSRSWGNFVAETMARGHATVTGGGLMSPLFVYFYDTQGNQIGTPFVVDPEGRTEIHGATLLQLADGSYALGYTQLLGDYTDAGSLTELGPMFGNFAVTFDGSGAVTGSYALTSVPSFYSSPSFIELGSGNVIAMWQDEHRRYSGVVLGGGSFGSGPHQNLLLFQEPTGGFATIVYDERHVYHVQHFDGDGYAAGSAAALQGLIDIRGVTSLPDASFVIDGKWFVVGNPNYFFGLQAFNPQSDPIGPRFDATVSVSENTDAVAISATQANVGSAPIHFAIVGGGDAALFTIDPDTGDLRFRAAPNFEKPRDYNHDNLYRIVIGITDGDQTIRQKMAVQVIDQNEAPVITSLGGAATATITVAENREIVRKIAATDPDHNALTYAITGGADAAQFVIDADGTLRFKVTPDFENPADAGGDRVYNLVVRVSDGTLSDTLSLAIRISDVARELLIGTDANDTLIGKGGIYTVSGLGGNDWLDGGNGPDLMFGGSGNDTYVVDDIGDRVFETVTASIRDTADLGGVDRVRSSISYRLGSFIEHLTLTGDARINGTGNAIANEIVGNTASNVLKGLAGNDRLIGNEGNDTLIGGAGNDVLVGGAGEDKFRLDHALSSTANVDTIADFSHGEADRILLSKSVFRALGDIGILAPEAFHTAAGATTAHDADDRIIYDNTGGGLYYDPDGSGVIAATKIAVLGTTEHPTLGFYDFEIVI